MKKIFGIVSALIICFMLVSPVLAASLAEDINSANGQLGNSAYGTTDAVYLPVLIGRIINVALGFLGILLVVYIIWGGYLYMTGGDEGVKKGKAMIKNAVIGLIICLTAYSISYYVIRQLTAAAYLT